MKNNEMTETKTSLPATTMAEMPEFQPMEANDSIRLPRLAMIQEKSPLIKDGLGNAGDLVNSLSKENYGPQIEVIPLVQGKSSNIRWKPRSSGGGILCIARDGVHGEGNPGGECANCVFKSHRRGNGPADDQWCSLNYQIIALVRETKEPIMLLADSIRPSDAGIRDMLGMARMAANKGIRLFGKSYILRSVLTKNAMGEFYKLACVPGNGNAALPAEEVELLAEQMKFFSGSKLEAGEGDGEF